jgi:hypothetical protein
VFNSPRTIEHAACTDGEGCERCWSYVGRFAPVTRIMRPLHRLLMLNMALAHFRQNVHKSLGQRLVERCRTAMKRRDHAEQDLADACQVMSISAADVVDLRLAEQRTLANPPVISTEDKDALEYFEALVTYQEIG